MGHDWMFDVLQDLKDYALANGFLGLAAKVEEAQRIAKDEVSAQSWRTTNEEPGGGTAH